MNIKTILGFFKKTVVDANVYPPLTARKPEPSATENKTQTPPPPPIQQTQK